MIKTVKKYYLLVWFLAAGQVHGQEVAKGKVKQLEVGGQEVPKIRIDPSKAHGGKVSEYFKEVEYIPLETTKESLFGGVGQLIVTDKSYVISDFDTKSVLFFSRAGNFIKKVEFKNNEFPNIEYFPNKKQISITVFKAQVAQQIKVKYSTLGELVAGSDINRNIGEELKDQYSFDDNRYFEVNRCKWSQKDVPEDKVYLVSIFNENKNIKNFLPYTPKNNPGFCSLSGGLQVSPTPSKGIYYATLPIEYIVYAIERDTVREAFQFVFPQKRSYDADILKISDKKKLDSLEKIIRNSTANIYGVSSIFFNRSRLFFRTTALAYMTPRDGSEVEIQHNFIFDTISKKLVSLERITPDAGNFYLPLIGRLTNSEGLVFDDVSAYSSISSLRLFAAYQKSKDRNPRYPPVLQKYFKTQNRKSNPVIVRMKLKE